MIDAAGRHSGREPRHDLPAASADARRTGLGRGHLPEDATLWCDAIVVEHRYIADIVRGAIDDDLVVQ